MNFSDALALIVIKSYVHRTYKLRDIDFDATRSMRHGLFLVLIKYILQLVFCFFSHKI